MPLIKESPRIITFYKIISFYKIYKNKSPRYLFNIIPARHPFWISRNHSNILLFKSSYNFLNNKDTQRIGLAHFANIINGLFVENPADKGHCKGIINTFRCFRPCIKRYLPAEKLLKQVFNMCPLFSFQIFFQRRSEYAPMGLLLILLCII